MEDNIYFDSNCLSEEDKESYNPSRDFTTLECWKAAHEIKLFFYKEVVPLLPEIEKYNLNLQIRKASISSTANISEGYGMYFYKEAVQFYRISRASQYELKDHLISCYSLNYVSQNIYNKGITLLEKSKIVLNGFIKYNLNQMKK